MAKGQSGIWHDLHESVLRTRKQESAERTVVPEHVSTAQPQYLDERGNGMDTRRRIHARERPDTVGEAAQLAGLWRPRPCKHAGSLPAFGGLDLASTQDLTAFALLFRDDECDCFYLIVHQFVNQDKADSKKLSAGIDYHRFAKDGHITITPGNVTDFRYVKEHIVEACGKYDVRSIGYDPRFSTYIVSELIQDDIEMHPMAQNITTMNGPTKEFEMQMMKGNIVHGGNEVLRWQMGCAVVYTDVNENKRVTKEKHESKKVDGVIASIIAMNEYGHFKTSGANDTIFDIISLS